MPQPKIVLFSGRSIAIFRWFLAALLLTLLSSCSTAPSTGPMLPPPASLSQNCPMLLLPPRPLNDPERTEWELSLVEMYGECAARHLALAQAWNETLKKPKR